MTTEAIDASEPFLIFPQSAKNHITNDVFAEIQVAMRRVELSNGEAILLYDTSGP